MSEYDIFWFMCRFKKHGYIYIYIFEKINIAKGMINIQKSIIYQTRMHITTRHKLSNTIGLQLYIYIYHVYSQDLFPK